MTPPRGFALYLEYLKPSAPPPRSPLKCVYCRTGKRRGARRPLERTRLVCPRPLCCPSVLDDSGPGPFLCPAAHQDVRLPKVLCMSSDLVVACRFDGCHAGINSYV